MNAQSVHILHLVLNLRVGGAERVVANLLRGQQGYNFRQSVCCLDEIGVLGEELIDEGFSVRVLSRKPGVDWQLIFKLRTFFRHNQVDLIHAHGESPWFYGALASWLVPWNRIPCITTIHGYGGGDRCQLESYRLWRVLSLLSAQVILVSDIFRKELENNKFSAKKLHTIVNGLDIRHFHPLSSIEKLRRRYGLLHNEFVIGIVARLSPVKNHALLLHAVARLHQSSLRPCRLMIVGDGPERKKLEDLTRKLGIENIVVFCGEQSDVAAHYALFDAFVLPSFSEGISMTILEAMAAGVPVIASDVGGNQEIINHPKNGFLFPSNDVDGLVEALRRLLNSPERGKRMARAGKQTVQTTFSMQTMLQRYRQVYGQALGLSHPSGEFA